MTDEALAGVDLYVAPDRQEHGAPSAPRAAPAHAEDAVSAQMRQKLQTAAGQSAYVPRKAIVEPVSGQIKDGRGFRRFAFRGRRRWRRSGW